MGFNFMRRIIDNIYINEVCNKMKVILFKNLTVNDNLIFFDFFNPQVFQLIEVILVYPSFLNHL